PFIARYRKEVTGALDEVQIKGILDQYQYLIGLEERKADVIRLIDEQGKLTEDLKASILKAEKLQTIEDLYRPYKQKRRTRATIAKEKGLEPFARWMLGFPKQANIMEEANKYISEEKEVHTIDEVIAGAKDIIAEIISDDATIRQWIRKETFHSATLESSLKKKENDE